MTRVDVLISEVEEAKSLPAEYQTLLEPASPVVQVMVAVVLACVAEICVMTGAVRSAVVNAQVVVFMNPPKKLSDASLSAVAGIVT